MKHTNILIISILVAIVVCGAYGYLYVFIQRSADDVLVTRSKVITEQSYKTQEQDLKSIYDLTVDDRARISSFFVTEGDTVAFIEKLESLGSLTGSTVSLSSIESIPSTEGVSGSLKVRAEARGSWVAVMRTLMLMESLPYKVSINKVRLDTSGLADKLAKREWRASLEIEAAVAIK